MIFSTFCFWLTKDKLIYLREYVISSNGVSSWRYLFQRIKKKEISLFSISMWGWSTTNAEATRRILWKLKTLKSVFSTFQSTGRSWNSTVRESKSETELKVWQVLKPGKLYSDFHSRSSTTGKMEEMRREEGRYYKNTDVFIEEFQKRGNMN